MPTIYLEPCGLVALESQLCGTPVITTAWGGFIENIQQGQTGFCCRTFNEFADAAKNVPYLDRDYIKKQAQKQWDRNTVKYLYDSYFKSLLETSTF